MAEKMTPERLEEIRDLECDAFPTCVTELLSHIDAQAAELTALKAAAHHKLFDWIVKEMADSFGDVDVFALEEKLTELGLITWLAFDENNKTMVEFLTDGDGLRFVIEHGDRFWFVTGQQPDLDALAAELEKESPDAK